MLRKKSSIFSVLFLILIPNLVAPEESFVYEYGTDNFKERIEAMDGSFIMFYAPWCSHCTDLLPIWMELAEMVNRDSKFAIAQVDCTAHAKLCHENRITGYPTLIYYHKKATLPVEYKGLRDLPSLTLFLSEVFAMKSEGHASDKASDVKIFSGVAYLSDANIEKFVSRGQHFIMFFAPWCRACQKLAPTWAELAIQYASNDYIQIGKVNCMENEMTCENFDIKQYPYLLWIVNGRVMGVADGQTLEELTAYVEKMLLADNHDPDKFMKKKKAYPVARISEENFETFLEKDLVFINYFAPWCAHCMQLNTLWIRLGEKFLNESRVIIADVDCVRSKTMCDMEKIKSLPTLVLYKNKQVVSMDQGGQPLENLITLVQDHLKEPSTSRIVEIEDASEEQTPTKDEL